MTNIRLDIPSLKRKNFREKNGSAKQGVCHKDDEIFLSDFIAAMRREFESVALIATSKDSEIPQLSLSEVKINFCYKLSSVSSEGVKIKVLNHQLSDTKGSDLQHLEVKLSDLDVHSELVTK